MVKGKKNDALTVGLGLLLIMLGLLLARKARGASADDGLREDVHSRVLSWEFE